MSGTAQQETIGQRLRPSGRLLQASSDLASAIDVRAVRATGLDPTMLDLLLRLRLAPDATLRVVDLCSQLNKSPSHLSRVVDRGETSGLIERIPDPTDRRAYRLKATVAGNEATDEYLPLLDSVLQDVIFSTLTPTEIDTLIDLLSRISQASRRMTADSPAA